ncbi:hypothetical protein EK904_006374 [Melospiza melodia maxima]|nr:hypothetical protein EK904_006374 [Melospiza melodia maxima]
MAGDSEGIAWEVLDMESHFPQEAGGSLELSNDTSFSLRIRNATGRSSGTYKCTLGEQNGERNLSSTVTLKVTGTVHSFDCPMLHGKKTCLRKESMSPNYQKTRPDMKHMLTLINNMEPNTSNIYVSQVTRVRTKAMTWKKSTNHVFGMY